MREVDEADAVPAPAGAVRLRRVLQAMNRRHDADDYRRMVERLRAARPDIALSSRLHRRLPRRDRGGFRRDAGAGRGDRLRPGLLVQVQPAARARRRRRWTARCRSGQGGAAGRAAGAARRAAAQPSTTATVGRVAAGAVRAAGGAIRARWSAAAPICRRSHVERRALRPWARSSRCAIVAATPTAWPAALESAAPRQPRGRRPHDRLSPRPDRCRRHRARPCCASTTTACCRCCSADHDRNLARIEQRLGVTLVVARQRGRHRRQPGRRWRAARAVLNALYRRLAAGLAVAAAEVDAAVRMALRGRRATAASSPRRRRR